MRVKAILTGLLMLSVPGAGVLAQATSNRARTVGGRETPGERPLVLGHGVGLFEIGKVLAQDRFDNLDNWVVQVQQRSGFKPARVEALENSLDCLVPGRGCTVWFRQKLKTRVTIMYDVLCPTPKPAITGVQPRDINNFWMATDPTGSPQGLFDPARYTGAFGSYDKMHGYYASTGGGGAARANLTTRMRRYPREVSGKPAAHIALNDKDGKAGYLITPDKWMTVQLVAYDDVIQYIVNGKLNYQIRRGDHVPIEGRDRDGGRIVREAVKDPNRFPVYREGHFGFRMVGTHHIYRNFRGYALAPDRREKVRVSSVKAFREAVTRSNQRIVMKPGTYVVSDLLDSTTVFSLSGSNNHIDLSGVTIQIPLSTLRKMTPRGAHGRAAYKLAGNNIALRGGTLENTYPGGMTTVTDFGSYNQNAQYYPPRGVTEMSVRGDDIKILGCTMTVRGSYPYGYGNIYGIGRGSAVGLKKHCGIQITGDRAVIDGCRVNIEAFGHAIFIQGGHNTTVRNTVVEGGVRRSDDLYKETDDGDLAKKFGHAMQWPKEVKGLPIPRGHVLNLSEDGIRAYGKTGHVTVDNCKVSKTRGGIKLYMAKSATVQNCEVLDCVIQGYSLPSNGTIANSTGNAAYGPLLYVHFDSHSSQKIELKLLPSPHGLGDHPLAAIRGRGHTIKLTGSGGAKPKTLRPIIVGYPMRFDFLCVDYPGVPKGYEENFARYSPRAYQASGITINNSTGHPVVLGKLSAGNTVTSVGPIRDHGANNSTTVSR